jgi:hypothetical protein
MNAAGEAALNTTAEHKDDHENEQLLKRQFSFQMGVADHILLRSATTTRDSSCEMPNNEIFELMDTSLATDFPDKDGHCQPPNDQSDLGCSDETSGLNQADEGNSQSIFGAGSTIITPGFYVQGDLFEQPHRYRDSLVMPLAPSLETNDLHGYYGSIHKVVGQTAQRLSRISSSASSDLSFNSHATVTSNTSWSDLDSSLDCDQGKQLTRQASLHDAPIGTGVHHNDIYHENSSHQNAMQTMSQRGIDSKISDELPTQTSFKVTKRHKSAMKLECLIGPLRTRKAINDITPPRNLKGRSRTR